MNVAVGIDGEAMYKNAAKPALQVSEKALKRLKVRAKATAAKAISKKNRYKNKLIDCPSCGKQLQRSVCVVQKHFLQNHAQPITKAEAYRIAPPENRVSRTSRGGRL